MTTNNDNELLEQLSEAVDAAQVALDTARLKLENTILNRSMPEVNDVYIVRGHCRLEMHIVKRVGSAFGDDSGTTVVQAYTVTISGVPTYPTIECTFEDSTWKEFARMQKKDMAFFEDKFKAATDMIHIRSSDPL